MTGGHYALFCRFIAFHRNANNLEAIKQVMRWSGGRADPSQITEWWNQWQTMREWIKTERESARRSALANDAEDYDYDDIE